MPVEVELYPLSNVTLGDQEVWVEMEYSYHHPEGRRIGLYDPPAITIGLIVWQQIMSKLTRLTGCA